MSSAPPEGAYEVCGEWDFFCTADVVQYLCVLFTVVFG